MDELRQKLKRYMENARPSMESIKALNEGGEKAKDTAQRYFKDAEYFMKNEEYVNAFAALEYAEGWLDCAVVLGCVKSKNKYPKNY